MFQIPSTKLQIPNKFQSTNDRITQRKSNNGGVGATSACLLIDWIPRDKRLVEKLATSDVSTADLIGEVDPIKISEGRTLDDETSIHFGLVPRANRGLFAINELPDLAEKIQVALFNVMEERDMQIKGFPVRLPLDVMIVASANPEDYTSRGRIITPLKDRFDAQIKTHYPKARTIEIEIMEQEARHLPLNGLKSSVPAFIKEILAEMTLQAAAKREAERTALFARKDANHDGHLTRSEFLANQPDPEQASKRFERFDSNKDGVLSREEFVGMGTAQ